jgi:hypothetical protein
MTVMTVFRERPLAMSMWGQLTLVAGSARALSSRVSQRAANLAGDVVEDLRGEYAARQNSSDEVHCTSFFFQPTFFTTLSNLI